MYAPPHFVQSDPPTLWAFMRAHPLATLVSLGSDDQPVVDLIPMWVEPQTPLAADAVAPIDPSAPSPGAAPSRPPTLKLLAHVARANPLWRNHPADRPVLVVFQGPNAYISPNDYPSKAQHARAVPTWNYAMVQARGPLRVVDGDPVWLRALLDRQSAQHEAAQAQPWTPALAPADYLSAMLQAVVGLEIEVTDLQGKFKLSQNQSADNRRGVHAALSALPPGPAHDTLRWMPRPPDTAR